MRVKSKVAKFVIVLVMILFILTGALAYFLISNEAPLIYGKVIYQVKYKEDQTLDIYFPTQKVYEKSPVLVYFHGGAWIIGWKEALNFNRYNGAVNLLRDKGYAVICPEYTKARKNVTPFPKCIVDAFDALSWIEKNADIYHFDLDNVGVFGESAGAHIAMMTAFAPANEFVVGAQSSDIKLCYVLDIYGPSNLEKLYHWETMDSIDPVLERLPGNMKTRLDQKLFGFDPSKDTLKAGRYLQTYSPIYYLDENAPPILMIHGNKDQIVPLDQSRELQGYLDDLHLEYEFHVLENVNHALRGVSSQQKDSVQKWIVGFIEKHYDENMNDESIQ